MKQVLFVPFALGDAPAYTARMRDRFLKMGLETDSLQASPDLIAMLERRGNGREWVREIRDMSRLPEKV